jgi:hypothetical protein
MENKHYVNCTHTLSNRCSFFGGFKAIREGASNYIHHFFTIFKYFETWNSMYKISVHDSA